MPSEKIKILSRDAEGFYDRTQAGKLLAVELEKYNAKDTIVLGIPRGGVVVAKAISRELNCKLDIVLTRKIGHPFNPEFAIGAVSESGDVFINEAASNIQTDKNFLDNEKAKQLEEIKRRTNLFRKIKPKISLKDKIVIITDDGLATGATMQASLMVVKKELPKKIIVALPVASEDALRKLEDDCDEIICLKAPVFFAAVGQFYQEFGQTSDDLVAKILKEEI